VKTNHNDEEKALFTELAAPFPETEIRWKPQTVSGNRALAVAYVDARCVMDRLDEVLGPAGWQDSYELLAGGCVKCELSVRVEDEWITKSDVGAPSEQSAECDQTKSAFSDALKRAAVKLGIGRYLYRLPKQWLGYDPQRRQFTETPKLPAWATPNGKTTPQSSTPVPAPSQPAQTAPRANGNGHPRTASELFRWVRDQEVELVKEGRCNAGELVDYLAQTGVAQGIGARIVRWQESDIPMAVAAALQFVKARSNGKPVH
jgi:hypothetical protein